MLELYRDSLWRANYLLRKSPQFESLEIHYGNVLDNPAAQAERIRDFLGNGVDAAKMAAVVDQQLYRNRR